MEPREWKLVKVYTYRTARSYGPTVNRDSAIGKALEAMVPERQRDNHIVAHFKDGYGDDVYLFIHDFSIQIGTEIVIGDW